ncbi:MAG: hydantoinase/oxoprolinase N-terminal domain-containing protein [Desulfovibrionaceae bacterium]
MAPSPRYAIGIDTGGTCTDAVALTLPDRTLAAWAKRPTTHYDLSQGIAQALGDVLTAIQADPAAVDLVAVSTTLATNAVVERRGSRVGLILIGPAQGVDLPVFGVANVRGGHLIDGAEMEPLDLDRLTEAIHSFRGMVDAYAVCAAMSFVNPAHEQVAARAIQLMDPGVPVLCSHEASHQAGLEARAATAVLHARLMPFMEEFLDGVRRALESHGLACPVRIVRGDASCMDMTEALRHAGDTFGSGPAATAAFGCHCALAPDALVVDVGGTTTDLSLIRGGVPTITEEGSRIGPWQTHIRAVEMFTVGLGGDSFARPIQRSGGKLGIEVGPERVMSLCTAPGPLPDPAQWMGVGHSSRVVIPAPGLDETLAQGDQVLLHLLARGPRSIGQLVEELRISEISLEQRLGDLTRAQLAVEAGFTPTDALRVLGRMDLGDAAPARAAAEVLAKVLGQTPEAVCQAVLRRAQERIAAAIIDYVARRDVGGNLASFLAEERPDALLRIHVTIPLPLVGMGAGAPELLPGVAELLGTELRLPEHHQVGNALGAALIGLDS